MNDAVSVSVKRTYHRHPNVPLRDLLDWGSQQESKDMTGHLSDAALWGRILARAENVTLALKRDIEEAHARFCERAPGPLTARWRRWSGQYCPAP